MAESKSNFLAGLGELPTPKKILILGLLGTAAAGFIFFIISLQKPSYVLLYSGLNATDASAVVDELRKERVPYEIGAEGGSILVPGDKLYEARLSLAGKGLPQNGVGFEIFDKVNIGTTEFVQKMNYQRAMQGELARTISQIDGVERSRVHISIPQESVFVEDQQKTTASVFLKLKPGFRLVDKQAKGISYLVAGAVEGLSAENVTIMDTEGRILSGPQDEDSALGLSSSQAEMQRNLEKHLEKNIRTMLEKVIGPGKVAAQVSATLNFKQVHKTEEIYDPNVTAVRSEQTSKEKTSGQNAVPSGVPGVASNVPGQGGGASSGLSSKTSQRQSDTVNYEINKVTRQVIDPVGTIKRLTVAVLVDGTYKAVKGSKELQYTPQTKEQMAKYETLIKGVVGFDASRGDEIHIENIPFQRGSDEAWVDKGDSGGIISPMMIIVLRYVLVLLFGILFLLFFVKPLVNWLTAQSTGGGYPATVGELESALNAKMLPGMNANTQENMKEEIHQLVKDDPALATTLVREWLNERG
ncbi:MAG: flagellar M-ring protein FliF [Deltaproteobacteria bacterium]|nr:flagellar M-ring protein FliF [Deltaproteobacteria bacterium]